MTGKRVKLVHQTPFWASGAAKTPGRTAQPRLRLEGTSPRATVKAASEVIWGMLAEVNWHGQILSLLAGSVRLTHRLKRRLMLRTSVNL